MAEKKTVEAAKKTAGAAKDTAVKAAEAVKTEAKAVEKAVKETAKTAKKAVEKKAAEKKTAAKKTDEKKETVVLQFAGKEVSVDAVVEAVKADFKANNKGYIRKLDVYVKPEDNAAYYVVNGKTEGKVEL